MSFRFTVKRAYRLLRARGPTSVLEVKVEEGTVLPNARGMTGDGLLVVVKSIALINAQGVGAEPAITVQIEDVPYPMERLVGATVVGM